MIFKMTTPIKFELSPRGTSNSLKSTLYPVRSLALQPLSARNSRLIFTTDNSKPIQRRALNLVSLDSLGSWESIYVYRHAGLLGTLGATWYTLEKEFQFAILWFLV